MSRNVDRQTSVRDAGSVPLDAIRGGDTARLGDALEMFREYLKLLARHRLRPDLATKADASDLVQETFLAAQKGFAGFRGSTEAEWVAWLEAILAGKVANWRRSLLKTRKRRGEPTPVGGADDAFARLGDSITPPSRRLQARERDAALEAAIAGLPDRQRAVIRWRHDDGLGFEEIGLRLAISADAARKLWARALLSLRGDLGADHDPR